MSAPVQAAMPSNLDLQDGYSLRVTALDPSTGALVAGVKIGLVVFTADNTGGVISGGGGGPGQWLIVPGPGA